MAGPDPAGSTVGPASTRPTVCAGCHNHDIRSGSGAVTASCPFKQGCNLNTLFQGDSIVELANNDNRMNYLFDTGGNDIIEQSTGPGQLWVQVGSFVNNHYGLLVNVLASDNQCEPGVHTDTACYAESGIASGNPLKIFCQFKTNTIHITDPWDWTDFGT